MYSLDPALQRSKAYKISRNYNLGEWLNFETQHKVESPIDFLKNFGETPLPLNRK